MTAAPGLRNQGVIGDSRRARFREEQVMERGLVKGGGENEMEAGRLGGKSKQEPEVQRIFI